MTWISVCGIRREGAEGFALTPLEVAKAFKARMDERPRPLGPLPQGGAKPGAAGADQTLFSREDKAPFRAPTP